METQEIERMIAINSEYIGFLLSNQKDLISIIEIIARRNTALTQILIKTIKEDDLPSNVMNLLKDIDSEIQERLAKFGSMMKDRPNA